MLVALFDENISGCQQDSNYIKTIDVDFLPNIDSLLMVNNTYYKIEYYQPISFNRMDFKEILCCNISEVYFTKEDNYEDLVNFFADYRSIERKTKIKNVLKR